MEWLWPVFKEYVTKELARSGIRHPTDDEMATSFYDIVGSCSVTVLVQEPWQNSVRFKTLARLDSAQAGDLYADPMQWLRERYGGGKFKLNFHKGWHFVATQNFKLDGEPRWKTSPDLDESDG